MFLILIILLQLIKLKWKTLCIWMGQPVAHLIQNKEQHQQSEYYKKSW